MWWRHRFQPLTYVRWKTSSYCTKHGCRLVQVMLFMCKYQSILIRAINNIDMIKLKWVVKLAVTLQKWLCTFNVLKVATISTGNSRTLSLHHLLWYDFSVHDVNFAHWGKKFWLAEPLNMLTSLFLRYGRKHIQTNKHWTCVGLIRMA